MLAMGRDETLTGLARGFAFRLVEALGVLPRDAPQQRVGGLLHDHELGAERVDLLVLRPSDVTGLDRKSVV